MSVVRFERVQTDDGGHMFLGSAPENPTDSLVWTVLAHERGGSEVWDCDEFGPWHRIAGPFVGPTGYEQACAALARMRRRELETAGDAVSQAGHEMRRQFRSDHIGDDWMLDATSPPATAAHPRR